MVSPAEAAAYPRQRALGESLVEVQAGERITERDALEALLLPSADNMAWILALLGRRLTGWPFVDRMNAQARHLGMHSTSYTDASGLAADTVSTAADQVRLGTAALKVPALAAIVAESTARVLVAGLVRNYNTLLGRHGVIGLKTGSTSVAGGRSALRSPYPWGRAGRRRGARSTRQGQGDDHSGSGCERPAGGGGRRLARGGQTTSQLGRQGEEQVLLRGGDLGDVREAPLGQPLEHGPDQQLRHRRPTASARPSSRLRAMPRPCPAASSTR